MIQPQLGGGQVWVLGSVGFFFSQTFGFDLHFRTQVGLPPTIATPVRRLVLYFIGGSFIAGTLPISGHLPWMGKYDPHELEWEYNKYDQVQHVPHFLNRMQPVESKFAQYQSRRAGICG